jgi:preprotein translocase subunit SecA
MLGDIFKKIIPSKQERDIKKLHPIVDEINTYESAYKNLSDEQLKAKTVEFRTRLSEGEPLDDILPEAFAAVREASSRVLKMRHFDVQMMGGIVLHQGKIAEMATGEGKTLVATLPLYLNGLTGRGAHLVTVNDYLAKRDRDWMAPIFEFLGLTVGVIQNEMSPEERRNQYYSDITYGTNSEFGFDYLRDNMSIRIEDQVQRGFNYAIVDEVDSILIDEARTPLIISGPVEHSTHKFDEMKKPVEKLVNAQVHLVNRLVSEAEQLMKEEKDYEAGIKLLQVRRGAPKHKRMMKLEKEQGVLKQIERVELDYTRDKKMPEIDEELFFSIDEKTHVVDLTEKGRQYLSPNDPSFFVMTDLDLERHKIDNDPSLPDSEKLAKKQILEQDFIGKSERLQNIAQLLKAYSLYEKDVEYVVQEGKVVIVDEFTGRLMTGRRFGDGLHEALEAKEGVTIERETQTLATITIQNYFRMYEKLAGMTGTAINNATEFWDVYKLDTVVVPTNQPMIRADHDDVIYKTRKEKYNAVIDEIIDCYKRGQPVLVGTISVDVSETIGRMLRMKGIKEYNILNAKQHQREAEIIANAGQKKAITIATNMAGRGTDIKLGEGVTDLGGLHILGTERHEAGRIDRQLRGRSGRQGDPGSSRFYLSLEDDLMRLFGSDKIVSIMDRLGVEEGEAIQAGLVTRAISKAQLRVEDHNYTSRKHLLEYDDLMNKQREVIYELRQDLLEGTDIGQWILQVLLRQFAGEKTEQPEDEKRMTLRELILAICNETLEQKFDSHVPENMPRAEWDLKGLLEWFHSVLPTSITLKEIQNESLSREDIYDKLSNAFQEAYDEREKLFTPEVMRFVEKAIVLRTVDAQWRDHLLNMDLLREGVGLKAFGATIENAALIEYKKEGHELFVQMLDTIKREIINMIFKVSPVPPPNAPPSATAPARPPKMPLGPPKSKEPIQATKKVGRNDPCPCGSGKKYKKCCGASVLT